MVVFVKQSDKPTRAMIKRLNRMRKEKIGRAGRPPSEMAPFSRRRAEVRQSTHSTRGLGGPSRSAQGAEAAAQGAEAAAQDDAGVAWCGCGASARRTHGKDGGLRSG